MSSSSSSSSDEEEINKLRAAVDPSFSLPSNSNGSPNPKLALPLPQTKRPKESKVWESGHSSQTIQIGPEAKEFLAKRLHQALDKQIKIVNPKNPPHSNSSSDQADPDPDHNSAGIYLFTNSPSKFTSADLKKSETPAPPSKKRKKCKIKKRKIDDSEDSDDDYTKLKSVAVSSDWVLNTKY